MNYKLEFIKETYQSKKDFIDLADSKANITLTIQSILISIGLGSSILSNTFQEINSSGSLVGIVLFYSIVVLFILFTIGGIFTSVLVYKARNKPVTEQEKNRQGLIFFKHIAKIQTADEYYEKIKKLSESDIVEEFSNQVYSLSLIVEKKLKWVNISIWIMLANIFLAISMVICGGIISIISVGGTS